MDFRVIEDWLPFEKKWIEFCLFPYHLKTIEQDNLLFSMEMLAITRFLAKEFLMRNILEVCTC